MEGSESATGALAARVIGGLGLAVLEVCWQNEQSGDGDWSFRLIGSAPPPWFESCFGSVNELCRRSAFLDDFVHGSASQRWSDADSGKEHKPLRSGVWEESSDCGEPHYFEAQALKSGSTGLLVIACVDEQHEREVSWVQHAHDEALQQRRLAKEREKKEILLDCIVHDLSSPLSTILMNVQHVCRQLERDDLREALDRAMAQAQRQRDLIHSIADVFASDLSAFESVLVGGTEGVDIEAVAREMVEAHEVAAGENAVRLEWEVERENGEAAKPAPPGWRVVGDRDHLARVFDNLLSNAVRHSPAGGVVHLRLRRDGERIRAVIEDDGPGIAPALVESAFRPFTQGGGEVGQSGLGLYFCKMTVELWGGAIGVDPRPVAGSCFWFELPIARRTGSNPGSAPDGKSNRA